MVTPAAMMPESRSAPWALLAASIAAYLAIFAIWYPPSHGIEDEVGFLNQALALSRGAITPQGAGFEDLADFREFGGRLVGIRNPGRPAVTAPFVAIGGLRAAFASGALLHVALTLLAAFLFVRLGLSPLWAALVLFHPTLALYSRTVMGDASAGLMLLGAVVAATAPRHQGMKAGLAVGAAAAMRYQAGLAAPFVAIAILLDRRIADARRQAVLCMLTAGAAGAVLVAMNYRLYGSATGIVKGVFGFEYLAGNAIFYGAALNVIWPLMLLVVAFGRSPVRAAAAAVWGPMLAFFLFYYFFDVGTGPAQTLVLGQRLLQVALPAMIAAYAAALGAGALPVAVRRLPARLLRAVVVAGLALLAAGTGLMFSRHQAHLENLLVAREAIVDAVPAGATLFTNTTAEKLVGVPYDGVPAYRLEVYEQEVVRELRTSATEEWYVALAGKEGLLAIDPGVVAFLESEIGCAPLPSAAAGLHLFRCGAP